MSGIGGQSQQAKLVTIQAELPPTVDGILERVRQILLLGEVQSLNLKVDEPIVYQRLIRSDEEIAPSESTQGFAELTLMDIVRNVPMEDFQQTYQSTLHGKMTPHEMIMNMWRFMEQQGWYVTHILTSPHPGTLLWPWLGIKELRAPETFFGARVEQSKEVNSDVFLLCGARTRLAAISEIGLVLKGNADAPEDQK
jgi:hypothetical protein